MKSTVFKMLFILFFVSLSSATRAESIDQGGQPCMVIKRACDDAGFKKSKECFSKVLAGESVSGVKLDVSVVSKCKDK